MFSCTKKMEMTTHARLQIEGMHCNGCAETIKKSLINVEGAGNAYVSFDSAYATVIFDSNLTNIKEITEAVEKKGYKVKNVEINEITP